MAQLTGAPRAPAGSLTPHPRRGVPRALVPLALRNPAYRRVWSGIAVLFLARWIEVAALSWLAAELTTDPFAIAMVGFTRIMPFFLFGPLGGIVADRLERRRVQVVARAAMAAVAVVAALLLATDSLVLWHIYVLGAASGAIMSMEVPARRAFTVDVVGRHAVTSGLAFDQFAVLVTLLIGPNVAGVLLPAVPGYAIFGAVAALYAASALFPPSTPRRQQITHPGREPLFRSFGSGLRIVRENRPLAGALIAIGVANMFGFAFFPLIPYFAKDVLHTGSAGLGLLISAEAAGGVVAVLAIAMLGAHFRHHGRAVLVFAAACHLTGFGLAFAPTLLGTWGLLALAGGFAAALSMMQANLMMIVTPPDSRGRLVGVEMVFGGAYPLGSLLVGGLADATSASTAILALSAVGLGLIGAVAVAVPSLLRPTLPSRVGAPGTAR
jgi:MFS family permease